MASNGRKAKDDKGYDHKFMDPVPNELLCLICLLPARDPQQSTCCGKVFCEACVNELKKHSNKCPGCRGDMNCFPDKRSKSHVAQHIKPSCQICHTTDKQYTYNRDHNMVCISVYGRRGSFFNISCTKTLFCPEISLVWSDSHSLTLPLSSDTSQVAFHSAQHSTNLL